MTGEIEMLILVYREEDNERQTGSQSCQVREKIKFFLSTLPLFQNMVSKRRAS